LRSAQIRKWKNEGYCALDVRKTKCGKKGGGGQRRRFFGLSLSTEIERGCESKERKRETMRARRDRLMARLEKRGQEVGGNYEFDLERGCFSKQHLSIAALPPI